MPAEWSPRWSTTTAQHPLVVYAVTYPNPDPEYNRCSLTGYDQFGRVVTSTDSIGRESVTQYDSLGRVSRSIQNYDDGIFSSATPDIDIETLYAYDPVGNTLIITDSSGKMQRTFYDALNRSYATVANWSGASGSITDTAGLANCFTLPADRDSDLCTLYQYDELGNTTVVTDSAGRMQRTFYDELNRTVATVANWQPATLSSPADCLMASDNLSDENICTKYGYDAAGNQITTTNPLSQTSLTVYDAANRPSSP